MKITLLLHSTTGNTRLITRYARSHLEQAGHQVTLHDVVKHPEPPELEQADLLGVSCPTMYFRPTYVMERFVARLPRSQTGLAPAFLLASAGGDSGAHFPILAEQLAHKDFIVLGAQMVPLPNNWPVHRAVVDRLKPAATVAELVARRVKRSRAWLAFAWPDLGDASPKSPGRLEAFLDEMVEAAERSRTGGFGWAPTPGQLANGPRVTQVLGRLQTLNQIQQATDITIDRDRCSRCGTCVMVCPSGCLERDSDDAIPRIGDGCTGCWTCFNRCPDGAISGWNTPAGVGQYSGPSDHAKRVFKPR